MLAAVQILFVHFLPASLFYLFIFFFCCLFFLYAAFFFFFLKGDGVDWMWLSVGGYGVVGGFYGLGVEKASGGWCWVAGLRLDGWYRPRQCGEDGWLWTVGGVKSDG